MYSSKLILRQVSKHVCRSLLSVSIKNNESKLNNVMHSQTDGVEIGSLLGAV